ncbi:transcription factor bHLH112-like isoform X1 [Cucurbita maxima]|uniref:Transcription factor bHLH112-like isoform X1 n=1 Tax=Cucurbita maxima TaxID=3661 RepID=A0A6J1KKS6_CUCMA|nr:transcription factor bHLH112-like isoform X1 [Cucurbita maxima]
MDDEFPPGICGRELWDTTKTLFSPAAANPSPCSIGDTTFLIDPTVRTPSNWNQNFLGDDGQRVDTTLMVDYDHQETNASEEPQNPSIFNADHDSMFLMGQTHSNFYDNIVTTTSQGLPMAYPFGMISNGYTPTLLPSSLDQPKQFLVNNRTNNSSCQPMFETLNFTTKLISWDEVVRDSSRVEMKNKSNEITTIKRPRNDMSSSLPTFKVRKEKLGDKITALQQLVSPFGKTDTASVLHEAIEYIKFLHDQVRVLSTPYMEMGEQEQEQQVRNYDGGQLLKEELEENKKQDLTSRGLCLVPIPTTVALANGNNTLDFWSPTFGGTFR